MLQPGKRKDMLKDMFRLLQDIAETISFKNGNWRDRKFLNQDSSSAYGIKKLADSYRSGF